ncbi:MAG: hypothetical protein CMM58_07515 [Rhodospirillaceae bacterium]|nr:hypothetical protein [Rhodospirillaceae bacterium]
MNRAMWILAAIFGIMAIAMIYQSNTDGGIKRPWAACKENLFQQMLTNACTPVDNQIRVPAN